MKRRGQQGALGLAAERPGLQSPGAGGRNLTYGLLDAIGREVVTGHYDGRAFPTEAELAREHSVSRSVTREAVKMLTAKGLLTARPRKGTTVQPSSSWNLFDPDVLRWLLERKFSLDLLRQFSELRLAIEPAAAALAAASADVAGIAAIRSGYARMEAAERGDDDSLEADIAFHIAIMEATGNPFYIQLREVVETALRTSIRFTNRYQGLTASLPHHRAVLTAIEKGNGRRAAAGMTVLITDVLDLIATAQKKA